MSYPYYSPNQSPRRSPKLESASFYLGIIAIVSFFLVYTSLICGSLSIVLALLSRGGEMKLTQRAKAGLIMGTISLVVVILLLVYVIVIANVYFGGTEEMLRTVYENMGIDYEALFGTY